MDAGKNIDFLMKAAEDGLSDAEKAVPAEGDGGVPETKTDGEEKTEPEGEAPSKTDGEEKDPVCICPEGKCSCREKTAASARDKAQQIAIDAGRPTSTGIAAGVSLGTLMASLGASSRAADRSSRHSLLSNPLLLGLLGAGAGYAGGNLMDKSVDRGTGRGSGLGGYLLDAAGVAGLASLGKTLAKEDRRSAFEDAAVGLRTALRSHNAAPTFASAAAVTEAKQKAIDALRKTTPSITGKGIDKALAMGDVGLEGVMRDFVSGSSSKGAPAADASIGLLERFKALTPFGKPNASGGLMRQLSRTLVQPKLNDMKALGPRAAALAALLGGGHLAYRAISSDY